MHTCLRTQLDMLRNENKELAARLDHLTTAIHSKLPSPSEPPVDSLPLGPLGHFAGGGGGGGGGSGSSPPQAQLAGALGSSMPAPGRGALASAPFLLPEKMGMYACLYAFIHGVQACTRVHTPFRWLVCA